jgi:hypothetical protein
MGLFDKSDNCTRKILIAGLLSLVVVFLCIFCIYKKDTIDITTIENNKNLETIDNDKLLSERESIIIVENHNDTTDLSPQKMIDFNNLYKNLFNDDELSPTLLRDMNNLYNYKENEFDTYDLLYR